jgi:hypothetical protein
MIFKKRMQDRNSPDRVYNLTGDGADLNTCSKTFRKRSTVIVLNSGEEL